MGMMKPQVTDTPPEAASRSDPKSPLQALFARGNLGADDVKDFEAALKHKLEHAERAAELLATRWGELPRELQLEVLRWKWHERKPESRLRACLRLGAAVAQTDSAGATGLLGEAVKIVTGRPGGTPRTAAQGATSQAGTGLRAVLRQGLVERWLQPIETAPLFGIRYSHLAREIRSEFEVVLDEALSGQPLPTRDAVAGWLQSQLNKETSAEGRHSVESALDRLQAPAPAAVAAAPAPGRGADSDQSSPPSAPDASSVPGRPQVGPPSIPERKPDIGQGGAAGPIPHPKVAIAEAVRVIQAEVRRWSSEDGSEMTSLRRRASELDESLKRRTQERDELSVSVAILKERCDQQARSLETTIKQRDQAMLSTETLEAELRVARDRVVQLEASASEAKKRLEQLDGDLQRVREDKRRDVEYTRDTERAAMAQELAQAARIHIENMKELLEMEPSEKQRTALQSCHEELARVLRRPSSRSNG